MKFDRPLRDEEKLPVLKHRHVEPDSLPEPPSAIVKKPRHKERIKNKDKEKKSRAKSKEHQSKSTKSVCIKSIFNMQEAVLNFIFYVNGYNCIISENRNKKK